MRAFSCVLFGVGVGAAMTALYFKNPIVDYGNGYDALEHATDATDMTTDRTFDWGTKARAEGTMQSIAGAVKERGGQFTGDDDLAMEG